MDGLFSDDEIESMKTPESKLSQMTHKIFTTWYEQWYHDEDGNSLYTQSPGHISKEIKNALKNKVDPYLLAWSLNILGNQQKPITAFNLQWALSSVRKTLERQGSMTNNSTENTYGESFE